MQDHTTCPNCKHDCREEDCLVILRDDLPESYPTGADFVLCSCGSWYGLKRD